MSWTCAPSQERQLCKGFSSEIQSEIQSESLIYFFSSERRGECWCRGEVFGSLSCPPSDVNLQELLRISIPGISAGATVSNGTQSPARAPCACSHPQGKGTVSPGSPRAPGEADVHWEDEPLLCYPFQAPKKIPFPVQKGELHWGRALGKERREMKAGDEQGCAQLWEPMWCWIPSPGAASLCQSQTGSG